MKKDKRGRSFLPPTLHYLLFLVIFALSLLPGILLFYYSQNLGYLWSILMFLYLGLVLGAQIWLLYRREMADLRKQLGEEQFFARFPSERKRELRILAIKKRWKQLTRKTEKPPWEG